MKLASFIALMLFLPPIKLQVSFNISIYSIKSYKAIAYFSTLGC